MQLRQMRGNRDGDRDRLLAAEQAAEAAVEVPPGWVTAMKAVRQLQNLILEDHRKLEELHSSHLKVQFGVDRDADSEEREIEALTASINRRFKKAESDILAIDAIFRAELDRDTGGTDAELSILRNVKLCLVNEVTALSRQVRDSQRRYLKAREKQKLVRDRWAGGTRQREVEAQMERDAMLDDLTSRGCTQEQIEATMLNSRMADERDQEFRNILESIKSLKEMFTDLHEMVIEQGSLLDRIDYNMTLTHERIVKSKQELVKAAKHQEAGSFKLCVLLLVILIIGFVLALLVKIAL